jgi:hypothetical protein
MPRTLMVLLTLASLSVPVAAQTPPAPPAPSPRPSPPQQPNICCCRQWSHGWQYAWRPSAECVAQNGSCVAPDRC